MQARRFITLSLILLSLTACTNTSEPDELREVQKKIEQALPTEYRKQFETEVQQFTFYDKQGNTIHYYLCLTTYFEDKPDESIGLHTDAFNAVFDVDGATLIKTFDASGHAAAIYQGETENYICCTTDPTASVVMSYDPDAVSEKDMIRSVCSIYDKEAAEIPLR